VDTVFNLERPPRTFRCGPEAGASLCRGGGGALPSPGLRCPSPARSCESRDLSRGAARGPAFEIQRAGHRRAGSSRSPQLNPRPWAPAFAGASGGVSVRRFSASNRLAPSQRSPNQRAQPRHTASPAEAGAQGCEAVRAENGQAPSPILFPVRSPSPWTLACATHPRGKRWGGCACSGVDIQPRTPSSHLPVWPPPQASVTALTAAHPLFLADARIQDSETGRTLGESWATQSRLRRR